MFRAFIIAQYSLDQLTGLMSASVALAHTGAQPAADLPVWHQIFEKWSILRLFASTFIFHNILPRLFIPLSYHSSFTPKGHVQKADRLSNRVLLLTKCTHSQQLGLTEKVHPPLTEIWNINSILFVVLRLDIICPF